MQLLTSMLQVTGRETDMVDILQNKNSATRFQILVEIAATGPNVPQKNIAAKLGVTPQAISDYLHQLAAEGLVMSASRSSYKVTPKGVNWMLKTVRELRDYISTVIKAVTNITVCAAIAEDDLQQGQTVGLKMKNGLLYATNQRNASATGTALSSARQGEDVDISDIEGLVELTTGMITVFRVPNIQNGGSKNTDLSQLQARINSNHDIGAIGIEALVTLRSIRIEPRYIYGVADAAVEAAHCGLPFTIVCSDDAIPDVLRRLQEENLEHELIDLRKAPKKT